MTFQQEHWGLLDVTYTYLDNGFTIIATTDVPCHLWARMTTTPPRKHSLPSFRRGLYISGDIRFCFVVYEDNEQAEAGDTLLHTFVKPAWPVCETRWFYFIGSINASAVVSESAIFEFHFPAPPPPPPPPIERYFYAQSDNRTLWYTWGTWPPTWNQPNGTIGPWHGAPTYTLYAGIRMTASAFIWRSFLKFDTSTLPDTAKIVSAKLRLFITYHLITSTLAYPYLYITQGIQQIGVVSSDYGAQLPYTTPLGQRHYGTLIDGQYNDIELNKTGLQRINQVGLTKFCLRGELDVKNIPPALGENLAGYHSEQGGVGFLPMLKVTYNPA